VGCGLDHFQSAVGAIYILSLFVPSTVFTSFASMAQNKPVNFVLRNASRYTVVLRRDRAVSHWNTSYTLKPHSSVLIDAVPGESFRMVQESPSVAYGVESEQAESSASYLYGEFKVPDDAVVMQGLVDLPIYRITENDFTQRQRMPGGTHMLTLQKDQNYMHETTPRSNDNSVARALGAGIGTVVVLSVAWYLIRFVAAGRVA